MREVRLKNFRNGMKVDNIDEGSEQIQSLLLLENADIKWQNGAAVRRKGYSYFEKDLAAAAKQIYEFVNVAGTATMLVIMDEKLYHIKSGVPTLIDNDSGSGVPPVPALSFSAYDYYPFCTVLNRCFFADDNDMYWFDSTSLASDKCYQLGITAPVFSTTPGTSTNRFGHETLTTDGVINTSRKKHAESFVPTSNMTVDAVRVAPRVVPAATQSEPPETIDMIVSIYSDSGGSPGTILAISRRTFLDIYNNNGEVRGILRFDFEDNVNLTSGTTYWVVVEVNEDFWVWEALEYSDAYIGYDNAAGYSGTYKYWDGDAWQEDASRDLYFVIGGGLNQGGEYNYAFTYVNNTYNSESEPKTFTGVQPTKQNVNFTAMDLTTSDNQVDVVRLYRTKPEDDTVYYYVTELATTDTTFWDNIDDENLGAEIQCVDHQRSQICPVRQITHWHNRLYISGDDDTNNHILYYSKVLESNGLTGIAGDPAYDYFPQQTSEYGHLYGNDFALGASITAIGRQGVTSDVANDITSLLVVITANDAIHTFSGGFDPQNPPQDLNHNPIILDEGILESRTLRNFKGRLVFLNNNKELKAYNGSIDLEDLSDDIQSLLDDVGGVYHTEAYNNRLWVLVDDDSDGVMDTVYVINLQRRNKVIYQKYTYKKDDNDVTLYDIHKGQAGLYALLKDALGVYHIVQLESGTSDGWELVENDGTEIVKKLQMHYIRPARRAYWQEVGIRGYYPTSTIPTLTTICTDLSARTTSFTLSPSGTEDEDGHKHGLVMASQELSVLIQSTGAEADEIREMFIRYRLEGE